MRSRNLASAMLLGGAFLAGCSDTMTAPSAEPADVDAAVRTGERLSRVVIRVPGARTSRGSSNITLRVGQSMQLSSMLYYSRGGSLSGAAYVQWGTVDGCISSVTNKYPNRGLVKGIRAGTVRVIAGFGSKADTVNVTVTGSGNADPSCERRRDEAKRNDESSGTPARRYGVQRGEKLTKLVLFTPRYTLRVGGSMNLVAELWYHRGGRLLASRYVSFTSLDTRVATVARGGKMRGVRTGTAKMAVRLGQYADTVEVRVGR